MFIYHSFLIREVTNLFKSMNLHIAFRSTNTLSDLLKPNKERWDKHVGSRIYKLTCQTCAKSYTCQTAERLRTRIDKQQRYIKTNNHRSACAIHILNISMSMDLYKILRIQSNHAKKEEN
jgi:hypothetical protein